MSFATLAGFAAVMDGLSDLLEDMTTDATVVMGTNVAYAPHQEFGTRNMPAQPHVRPAIQSVSGRAEQVAAQADSAEDLLFMLGLRIETETKRRAPIDTGNLRASYRTEKL